MLGRLLFVTLCIFLSNGVSFEEEASALLLTQGVDFSDLAAASTSTIRKDALKTALTEVRKQLVQQVTDVKNDFSTRENARVKSRDQKVAAAGAAKSQYDAALKTFQTLQAASVKADATYKTEKEDDLEETNRLTANVDRVLTTLSNILNGKPVVWALDGWTGNVNAMNGLLNQGTDQYRAFCGFGGVHDNDKQDRVFRVRRCRPVTAGEPQSVSDQKETKLTITKYEEPWTRECPRNQYISTLYSTHDNGKQDRIWTIGCKSFYQIVTRGCTWTGWLNVFNGGFYYNCAGGNVLSGIRTEFDKVKQDRRFAALCCTTRRSFI